MMGSVNSIESFGLLDGPGIRTVIFLNGCKLRCKYCHNPEMWEKSANNMSALEAANIVIRNKSYFKDNGGVTFSGGEPLLQPTFIIEVCKILKENDIHICLDTAGAGNGDYKKLLSYIDLVIFDVKHIDSDGYKGLTGYSISNSLEFLDEAVSMNKKLWIRQVIIPGVNDSEEYIRGFKEFIKDIPLIEKVEFLPFHRLGKEKYDKIGINYPYEDKSDMDKIRCEQLYKLYLDS